MDRSIVKLEILPTPTPPSYTFSELNMATVRIYIKLVEMGWGRGRGHSVQDFKCTYIENCQIWMSNNNGDHDY
jgi:hypothetical protein